MPVRSSSQACASQGCPDPLLLPDAPGCGRPSAQKPVSGPRRWSASRRCPDLSLSGTSARHDRRFLRKATAACHVEAARAARRAWSPAARSRRSPACTHCIAASLTQSCMHLVAFSKSGGGSRDRAAVRDLQARHCRWFTGRGWPARTRQPKPQPFRSSRSCGSQALRARNRTRAEENHPSPALPFWACSSCHASIRSAARLPSSRAKRRMRSQMPRP